MACAWLQLTILALTTAHCAAGEQDVARLRGSVPTSEAEIFRYIQTTSYEPWEQLTTVVAGQAQAAAICGGFKQLVMGPTIAASAAAMAKIFNSSTEIKVVVPTFTKVVDFETVEDFTRHITCLTPIIRRYSRTSETFKSKFQYYSRPTSISTGNIVAVEEFFNVSAMMADTLVAQYHELFVMGNFLAHSDGKQAQVPNQSYTGFHQADFGSVTSYQSESDFLSSLQKRETATPQKSIDQEINDAANSAAVAISVFNATVIYTM